MTAIVHNPNLTLHEQLGKVHISQGQLGVYSSFKKEAISEAEKQRRIYQTSYEPSIEWWNANQAEYKRPEHDPLPEGFPEKVDKASVWDGKVLINQPEKWVYRFTLEDIDLINKAHDHFVALNIANNEISTTTFPIPSSSKLYAELQKATAQVKSGLGFTVLRGLPVNDWSREKQIRVFAGISSYFGGERIKQGVQNIVHLRDITNLDVDKRPAITVKGQTSGNQVFHNDGTIGIIGLITLGVAESGGLSQLSSVAQTYNYLASTRRDILRELAADDWKNKLFPEGKPLIFSNGDDAISSYSRRPFFGFYEADADVPPLSTEKHLALDAIHFTAEKFSLDLELQVGDLEYANNQTIFHARTSSVDSEKNQRHLIRVHLSNPDQPLPGDLRETFDKINAGVAHAWPLEAWDSVDGLHGEEQSRPKAD